jgi:S-DNA-T family DNA segregation ATPase FtsK/SpoIIIE
MDKIKKIKEEIAGIIAFVSGIIILLSLLTHNPIDPSPFTSSTLSSTENLLGPFGAYISDILLQVIGFASYAFSFVLCFYGIKRILCKNRKPRFIVIVSIGLLMLSLSSLFSITLGELPSISSGGIIGTITSQFLLTYFSYTGSLLIFVPLLLITLMLLFPFSLVEIITLARDKANKAVVIIHEIRQERKAEAQRLLLEYSKDNAYKDREKTITDAEVISEEVISKEPVISNEVKDSDEEYEKEDESGEEYTIEEEKTVSRVSSTEGKKQEEPEHVPEIKEMAPLDDQESSSGFSEPAGLMNRYGTSKKTEEDYKLPELELLRVPVAVHERVSRDELIAKSRLLEKKLQDFDISGRVTQVYPGPVVAMFEFEPAPGVKINKIVSLADDLALTLKAMSVRVSPIPGKAALGIEVPNKLSETVYLQEVLSSDVFIRNKSKLVLALGKNIFGNPVVTDLARMPHLLVAGATGSGKSVAMNSMVLSLLFRATPQEVKMLMIDPKLLELSIYNDIPHLLLPVITTPKGAAEALKRMVVEMEFRYKQLAEKGARNIDSFNKKISSEEEFMPYIVIFIDELADLMLTSKRDVEDPIARIAQMARAAGIHMVLATQRPSVDVITGVIKANFPSRISFQVSSKVDSRTILDTMGAEKLLGRGDMLFITPGNKMMRVHGAYVTEEEISSVVECIKSQEGPDYAAFQTITEEIQIEASEKEGRDELYKRALEIVLSTEQASISYLQRRLKIGYNRAARIIEMMEEDGIVGPPGEAGKPREILKKK